MFSTPARRRAAWFVIGVLAASLTLLALVSIVQTRELAGTIRESQKQRVATFDLLLDCTDPAGKCFKRGQRQTARAVASINQVTIAAASCGSKFPGQTNRIRSCILDQLDKERK